MRCGDIIGGDNINAIGFIGAGKCGMSLAYYFRSKGVNVIGFSSRSNNTEDFELYSREKLINNSDIIFITTNDDNIQTVWNKIKDMNLKEKIICHCSGSVSSEIFKGADSENVCSVHPMLAFNSKQNKGIFIACLVVGFQAILRRKPITINIPLFPTE